MEKDSYDISEFCERNSISRGLYYKELKNGKMPTAIRIGARRLITKESAEAWRKKLEAEAAR